MAWSASGHRLQELSGHCVALLPDGRLVLGSDYRADDTTLEIWVEKSQARSYAMRKSLAKDVARQRVCGDVGKIIVSFL